MSLTLLTPPAGLTLAGGGLPLKAHLRVDGTHDDVLIEEYLAAAVAELDGPTGLLGRCILPQVWQLELSHWHPSPIRLPVEPVRHVIVRYTDAAGAEQVLESGLHALDRGPRGVADLVWTGPLPPLAEMRWPVRVEIAAGFETLPREIGVMLMMRVAEFYERREAHGGPSESPAYAALLTAQRRHL